MNILFLTGCNGQLGLAISKKFKDNSWHVYGLDINDKSSNDYLKGYVTGSVTNRNSFIALYQQAMTDIKNQRGNIKNVCLINNAGVAVFTPSEERTDEEFENVTKVNILGPIYGITEFKKFFVDSTSENETSFGRINLSIINISSIYSLISPNNSIYTDTARNSSEIYGASKAGVNQLTRYFAIRYAEYNIQVNAIAPGGVLNETLQGPDFIANYSNLVPMKRLCDSTEIADVACNLAALSVKYLTGQIISIDGGMSSW